MTQSRVASVATIGLLFLLLPSCAPNQPTHQISDAVGQTLDEVTSWLKEDRSLITLDISPRVGLDPQYNSGDPGSEWIVVAACASAETLERSDEVEVAVLPLTEMTNRVKADVDSGAYADTVYCENERNYR